MQRESAFLSTGLRLVALGACLASGCYSGVGSNEDSIGGAEDAAALALDAAPVDVDAEAELPEVDAGPPPQGVSTLAGASEAGADDGRGAEARFHNPVNVLVGPDGLVYVADFDNGLIRRITPDGDVSTFTAQPGFERPFGLAFAPDGRLFVETDTNDQGQNDVDTGTLWRIDPDDGAATVVVRNVGRPRGLAFFPDGTLAVTDDLAHVVALVDVDEGTYEVLAGTKGAAGFVDAAGAAARFRAPAGVIVVDDETLLVADRGNHRIRLVTRSGAVSTFAGDGIAGTHDGVRDQASFDAPQGLAQDGRGNVYVSDLAGYVRALMATGDVITIAGDGSAGFRDGDPRVAAFYGLEGLSVTEDGTALYVADGNRGGDGSYHRVRRIFMF